MLALVMLEVFGIGGPEVVCLSVDDHFKLKNDAINTELLLKEIKMCFSDILLEITEKWYDFF